VTRLTPWHDSEAELARSTAAVRLRGYIRAESEAWAVALTEARRVIPDVVERELQPHIGHVGDPRWLELLVADVARQRARALSDAAGIATVYDEADDAA